jgi:protein gp37
MGANSKIEWTHHTFNPWRGCTKVSAGCANCYAEATSVRNPKVLGVWGPRGTRVIAAESYWRQPLAWNAAARAAGERHRVFCASLADVFEGDDTMPAESVRPVRDARARLFNLIDATPFLDWLLVTKRPENIRGMWPGGYMNPPPMGPTLTRRPNVWLLTSVEDQPSADKRIPELLKCRDLAAVLGLSIEPLLGPVDLTRAKPRNVPAWWQGNRNPLSRIDWVIVGGESGHHARPMHPEWPRGLRDQCQAAGVPFFFKQWGDWRHGYSRNPSCRLVRAGLHDVQTDCVWMEKVGKDIAGRQLDGRTWDEFPEVGR